MQLPRDACSRLYWKQGERQDRTAHGFCSPQKCRCGRLRQVSWLGGSSVALRPLHLPQPTAEWHLEATRPHLQWRNRAGLAPDFPVRPVVGTLGEKDVSTKLHSSTTLTAPTVALRESHPVRDPINVREFGSFPGAQWY